MRVVIFLLTFINLIFFTSSIVWSNDLQKIFEDCEKGDCTAFFTLLLNNAEQGDVEAQFGVASFYRDGKGTIQNYEEAIKWFKIAAEQGFAPSQFNLGVAYSKGIGIEQDKKEAVKWYQLSAEQGDVQAQFNLAFMFKRGEGVEQSFEQTLKYYRLSAEQGFAESQRNLGMMYYEGEGVTQNYEEAYKWTYLAFINDDKNKNIQDNLDFFANNLTQAQIDKTQKILIAHIKIIYLKTTFL